MQEKNKENLDILKFVCKFASDGWSRPTQVGAIKRFGPFFIFMAKISLVPLTLSRGTF